MSEDQQNSSAGKQEPSSLDTNQPDAPPPGERLTPWKFVNSQLMLWFLSSVLVSGVSYYWNHRTDERDDRRVDSQFLGTMIPYLTSPDVNVRLRAVDVIQARYPDGQFPPKVSLLITNIIRKESAGGPSRQTEETKTLIANAARTLDKQVSTDPNVKAAVQQLPARIYLRVSDEAELARARELQALLRQQGFLVPGIENISGGAKANSQTLVLFSNDSDRVIAERVGNILIQNGFSTVAVERSTLKANPGSVEVALSGPSQRCHAHVYFNGGPNRGSFGEQAVSSRGVGPAFGVECLDDGSSTIQVTLTGPFGIPEGSELLNQKTIFVESANSRKGMPKHFYLVFRPEKVGQATGSMKIASTDSSLLSVDFQNPLPLSGVGK